MKLKHGIIVAILAVLIAGTSVLPASGALLL
jgi:hypothetical protein